MTREPTNDPFVIVTNNVLERARALRASGMKWRDIQDEIPILQHVPLQSLFMMCKTGEVFPKYRPKDTRRRYRINVDPDTFARVRAAAEAQGVTVAELVRRAVELEINRQEK